jgi:ribosomal protein L13E
MPYAIYNEVDNAIRKVKRHRTKTQRRRKVAQPTSLRSGERLAQLPEKQIEIHRHPAKGQFREQILRGPGETLASVAVPGLKLDVAGLFP